MKWIKQMFCKHRFVYIGYLHSNFSNGKNKLGQCKYCGKLDRFK